MNKEAYFKIFTPFKRILVKDEEGKHTFLTKEYAKEWQLHEDCAELEKEFNQNPSRKPALEKEWTLALKEVNPRNFKKELVYG